MTYTYDKDYIKNNLSLDQIYELLADLGGEPQIHGEVIWSKTICHGGEKHRLWYWDNTKLLKCFTDCGDTFDIYELVRRVKSREYNKEWQLPQAIEYVAEYFGYSPNEIIEEANRLEDWTILEKYDKINKIDKEKKIVELKTYDAPFLKNLPRPHIASWENENITKTTMDYFGICYEPKQQAIVIPHYDIEGNIVGIRRRTMVQEVAEKYGKYTPLKIGKTMYNHALSLNLYGLYQNKENIIRSKKAILLEGEKSVLQLESYLGRENNIGVAVCGSSVIAYQVWLLIGLGVKEIIVALDRQYQEIGDKEFEKLKKNLMQIQRKYGAYITISFIFDKKKILPYKASPTDINKEIFMKLYKERISLYDRF